MSALDDVKSYMEFWGWTNGGNPGSVKNDSRGNVIATHGDKIWSSDVENACATLNRIADRACFGLLNDTLRST
jgi:hypothetical protein